MRDKDNQKILYADDLKLVIESSEVLKKWKMMISGDKNRNFTKEGKLEENFLRFTSTSVNFESIKAVRNAVALKVY